MKIVIQIVDKASCTVDNQLINEIQQGYLIFVGVEATDNEEVIEKMANKIVNMRINKDENGKTNLSILDIHGEILSISQFTLCADCEKRRPSFSKGANPIMAKELYEKFNAKLNELGVVTKDGVFGAEMIIDLVNHGPFTIVL